jgi:hypothetical protein
VSEYGYVLYVCIFIYNMNTLTHTLTTQPHHITSSSPLPSGGPAGDEGVRGAHGRAGGARRHIFAGA